MKKGRTKKKKLKLPTKYVRMTIQYGEKKPRDYMLRKSVCFGCVKTRKKKQSVNILFHHIPRAENIFYKTQK